MLSTYRMGRSGAARIVRALCFLCLNVLAAPAVSAEDGKPSPSPQQLRVALAQLPIASSLNENRDAVRMSMKEAAARKAQVVVVPEGTLTGSGSDDPVQVEQALESLREAARQHRISLVLGADSCMPPADKVTYWMLVIGPDGRDVMRYEKLYSNHQAAMPPVFDIDGVPCGASICADRWLRGVSELPLAEGAKVHFEIACNFACEWVEPFGWYWNAPFARRNSVWTVLVNSCNRQSGVADPGKILHHGHSAVLAPDGTVLAQAASDTPELVVCDLDLSRADRQGMTSRMNHPAMKSFWETGMNLHQKQAGTSDPIPQMSSPPVELTVCAATATGLAGVMNDMKSAAAMHADLVAFPAAAVSEEDLPQVAAAANRLKLAVVVGATRHEQENTWQSAWVYDADGRLLTRHDQLSATAPLAAGNSARTMWFLLKGVPAVVMIGTDAEWTELAELAVVAGARLIVHIDHDADTSADARLRRLQTGANMASFITLTVQANVSEAVAWDDLSSDAERRAIVKSVPVPGPAPVVEVYADFGANLVCTRKPGEGLAVVTRKIPEKNAYHPGRTTRFNPQMHPWYAAGVRAIWPESSGETTSGVSSP